MSVRLVKGAYWDYETIIAAQHGWPTPVWPRKWESDAAYERLAAFLIENRIHLRPCFGSHNIRSLAKALALARVENLPPGSIELQMLYGMADPIKDALVRMGQRVRVYTPYGELLPTGSGPFLRSLAELTESVGLAAQFVPRRVPVAARPTARGRPVAGVRLIRSRPRRTASTAWSIRTRAC